MPSLPNLFDATPLKASLTTRIDAARNVAKAGELTRGVPGIPDISRESRGIAIVLLYAAYENLLKETCRALLEGARLTRAKNARFRPGIRLFAAHGQLQALTDIGKTGMWKGKAQEIANLLAATTQCTIDTNAFPTDGSHMKREQIGTLCDVFSLSNPGQVLREVWQDVDGIVAQRNAVAHGRLTAEEVGRRHTYMDLMQKIDKWETRWIEWLDWVEQSASSREFYLLPR